MQEIRVTVDRAADVVISVGIDPTGVPGRGEYPDHPRGKRSEKEPEGLLTWMTNGDISDCGLAYGSEFLGAAEAERATTFGSSGLSLPS